MCTKNSSGPASLMLRATAAMLHKRAMPGAGGAASSPASDPVRRPVLGQAPTPLRQGVRRSTALDGGIRPRSLFEVV